jgi:hypothetical protein
MGQVRAARVLADRVLVLAGRVRVLVRAAPAVPARADDRVVPVALAVLVQAAPAARVAVRAGLALDRVVPARPSMSSPPA